MRILDVMILVLGCVYLTTEGMCVHDACLEKFYFKYLAAKFTL